MATLLKTKSLNYSDVNLIAQLGAVKSRSEIPVEGWRIIVSAMTSIIGPTFIRAVGQLPPEKQPTLHIPRDIFKYENLETCFLNKLNSVFVGVGLLGEPEYEMLALHYGFTTAFIDIANGYLPQIEARVKQLKAKGFEKVICGSVHTKEGYQYLCNAGVDIIRSGIAPGSVCITKDSTGFTRGTFTEIFEMSDYKDHYLEKYTELMADGGIKSPSDCVKAFLAGADYIMSGRLFVECFEARMHRDEDERRTPDAFGRVLFPQGVYFGMASELGKIAMGKEVVNVEGKLDKCEAKQMVSEIIDTLWAGINSGVSYSGYKTLCQAIGNGVFEEKAI